MIVIGVAVMIVGYFKSRPLFKPCGRCKDPLVDGYAAYDNGKYYCLRCCRETGIRPWYLKHWMTWP
jgi:hypothetical protein